MAGMSKEYRRRLRTYLLWAVGLAVIGYLIVGLDAVRVAIWAVIVYPVVVFARWFARSSDRFHGGGAS